MDDVSESETVLEALELAWTSWGPRHPSLVLIHGLRDCNHVWAPLTRLMGEEFSGVAVDLRGHGDSPHDPLKRYAIEDLAADVVALIRKLGISKLVLVGHSLGAEVAIDVARALPQFLSGLILIEGGPNVDPRAAAAIRETTRIAKHQYGSIAQYAGMLIRRHPAAEETILVEYAGRLLRPSIHGGLELKSDPCLTRSIRHYNSNLMIQKLLSIGSPKLLVRGAFSAAWSRARVESLTGTLVCDYRTIARAGHSIPLDNPSGLSVALGEFLSEQPANRS